MKPNESHSQPASAYIYIDIYIYIYIHYIFAFLGGMKPLFPTTGSTKMAAISPILNSALF